MEGSPPSVTAKVTARAAVSPTTRNLKEGMNRYLSTGSVKKEKREDVSQPPTKRKRISSKPSNEKRAGDGKKKHRSKRTTTL